MSKIENKQGINRKEFLKITGTGALSLSVLSTMQSCGVKIGPSNSPKTLDYSKFKVDYVPSVCLNCPAGCGILVRKVNGIPVKIEGNPLYPSNRAGTCPKGQIGLQILYDPDRIKSPMKQMGKRGDINGFVPISWDEAIQTLASKLKEIREKHGAHTILGMGGRFRGQMHHLMKHFYKALGTPNEIGHSSICEDGSKMGHWVTQGWKSYAAYDWDNCNYVLCFGASFLEAWRPTARLLKAWGDMRSGRIGLRTKFVMIDPRFSVTSAKADEFLRINPGTDAALALGIAYVIVNENLYDRKFIDEHGFGFEDWDEEIEREVEGKKIKEKISHLGFKNYLLKEWNVEKASKICGIPAKTITRIAREFASKAPHCIAAGARGTSMQSNGIFTRFAIHVLNGLVGSIDSVGGVWRQIDPPLTKWPDPIEDDIAKEGNKQPRIDYAGTTKYPLAGQVYQDIPDRILEGKPYEAQALLCYYTNPMFSPPELNRWEKAIQKIPFIATFSPFMDETTANADLILPDCTYLERWQDDVIYPSLGYPVVGIRVPVCKPIHDTRNTMDVIIQTAKAMGGTIAESFPWKDAEDLLKFTYKGIWEKQNGLFTADTFDEWWEKFCKYGVWHGEMKYPIASENPEQWARVLVHHDKEKAKNKEAGKFYFYSKHLEVKLRHLAEDEAKKNGTNLEDELEKMLTELKIPARGDELYLPHYQEQRYVGDKKEYPLVLITYKTITHAEGRGANVPMAQERAVVQTREKWTNYAQLNPETAKKLGLEEDDEIWIESPIGKIKTRVKFLPHHPEVVAVPFELGHKEYGRWAKNRGVNPNSIIANEHDNLGGLASFSSTRVKIYKA